jgi:3' terminal RNA ribose 2'-O-methyltransferase Hen1
MKKAAKGVSVTMQLTIKATGKNAKMISFLLAKNPNNVYDRDEKDVKIRLVYTTFQENEVEVLLFVTPDPIDLVRNSPTTYDITQYINDREFAVSSLFCSYARSALGTALNGKPKEEYLAWVDYGFDLQMTFGPVASNLPDHTVEQLFTSLGYEIEIERGEISYTFELKKRSSARFITVRGNQTIQTMLRQIFILIPVLDDYKHYYITDDEIDKFKRYGEGWLQEHPLRDLIIKRTLRFSNLIDQFELKAADEVENVENKQPKVRLNELRYQGILETVRQLKLHETIVDYGSGEGKLSARLGFIPGVREVLAVEPSSMAQLRAIKRFEKLLDRDDVVMPTPVCGSLFYYDDQLSNKDVMILCEVIEHINAHRLAKVMETIFAEYRPKTLIVTTPNKEYNEVYEMDNEELRHQDHRFEWNRYEYLQWCEQWSERYPYDLQMQGIGEESEGFGQPTQMAVFVRKEELNKHDSRNQKNH